MFESMSREEQANLIIGICDEYGIPYTRNLKYLIENLKEAIAKREALV